MRGVPVPAVEQKANIGAERRAEFQHTIEGVNEWIAPRIAQRLRIVPCADRVWVVGRDLD